MVVEACSLCGAALQVNTLRDPQFDNPVGNVWMTEDGECYDEMNRALWTVAFNTIMQV